MEIKHELIDTEDRLVIDRSEGRRVGNMDEGDQKKQTINCRISKSLGHNVECGDYS